MTISERVLQRWKTASDPRRPGWLPKDTPEIKPEGTDLVLYPHELGGNYGLMVFMGKQSKPFHNFTYGKRKHDRDKAMDQLIENNRARHKRKEDERAEKKQFKTDLFYGDIFYTSWGYDQTRAHFYEVTEVVGPKTVKVRPIAKRSVPGTDHGGGNQEVMPVPGAYQGSEEMEVRVRPGNRATIDNQSASKWDGRPVHESGEH